ncbi:LysR family transcriptional regulator [Paenibacillus sp. 1P07SE]|uniref:LysR family transcriptional regulator n=1 Tax=Paenibacillus sp. 1P07SE TaxID=3132209 RepID=UPI0039A465C9
MELRHLITLRAIVESGGFKKAADELGYAQSSITAHIQELERELGYPLFDRIGKTVALTAAGSRFLPYALDIISLYSESREAVQEPGRPTGRLTVGASESVMTYFLPARLQSFLDRYPDVELVVKPLDYQRLNQQLQRGDIDLALLVELAGWAPPELEVRRVREEQLPLVRAVQRQRREMMLYTEHACSYRPVFDDYMRQHEASPSIRVELPSIEAIKQCVLSGVGKSFLPGFTVERELAEGRLQVEPYGPADGYPIAIYCAMHRRKWQSVNVTAFLEELWDGPMPHEERAGAD